MGREVVVASRCQLIIGSFDGASNVCSCSSSKDCNLTKEQRQFFSDDERVLAAKAANIKEYEDGKANNAKTSGQEQAESCS